MKINADEVTKVGVAMFLGAQCCAAVVTFLLKMDEVSYALLPGIVGWLLVLLLLYGGAPKKSNPRGKP